jgi:regulator of sigma E protease
MAILTLVIVVSLLVFVHEFGHFITAKRAGVRVDEFGFGFPPRAFGVKRGGTIYSINWIPLGGFVKIKGESGEDRADADSFGSKPLWRRALVLLAGVLMNVVLGWFLLTVGYVVGLPQVAEDLSPYARVEQPKIQVVTVLPGSPADRAAMESGDEIVAVGGAAVDTADAVRERTTAAAGEPVALTVRRDGAEISVEVVPETLQVTGRVGIGVALARTGLVSYPWYVAPLEGAHATWVLTGDIVSAFASLVRDLFTERRVTQEFSGPVGIAFITADVAQLGFRHLLQFTALLSLNLAVINVLPLPALDGGRVLFLAIEAVRGRAVGRRIETAAHNLGFALLMLLVLFVTYKDLVKYGARILGAFSS